ncbi:unannotated protein [freshwater metagenome]|uniref:Unannotated protein n=1 Tax=freshwater metagenome TaxID=449393 RepID=A0A6J6Q7X2_9ZZZZ
MTPIAPPKSANPTLRFLLYAAALTGSWAGLLSLLVYGIGRLLGVPFEVPSIFGGDLTVVPWLLVLFAPVFVAVVGALLSRVMLGRRGARRVVYWGGTFIALLSLSRILMQPADVLWSTRIWLAIPNVITWLLVVPQLARIVGDSEPGASVERDA